jgi:hypothetical protein
LSRPLDAFTNSISLCRQDLSNHGPSGPHRRITVNQPWLAPAIQLASLPQGWGTYQIGEVYARSVVAIFVPGSGLTPNVFAS